MTSNWDARAADPIARAIDPSGFSIRAASLDPEWRPELQQRREAAREVGRRIVGQLRRAGWRPTGE